MKKVWLTGLSALLLATTLTACGDDSEEVAQLKSQLSQSQAQLTQVTNQMNSMAVTEVPMETSLQRIVGSDVPVFKRIDGILKFPNKLQIPNSSDDVNNSRIQVGSYFTYTPSDNWAVRVRGTILDMSHAQKIWGSIKAVQVDDSSSSDGQTDPKTIIQDFFKGFPATTIKYRKLFMDEYSVGLLGNATITVDNKKYKLTVGYLTRGEAGQLYLFGYEDNKSGVQQELIDLLIGSGVYGDSKIKIE